jgi:hypothetical protein
MAIVTKIGADNSGFVAAWDSSEKKAIASSKAIAAEVEKNARRMAIESERAAAAQAKGIADVGRQSLGLKENLKETAVSLGAAFGIVTSLTAVADSWRKQEESVKALDEQIKKVDRNSLEGLQGGLDAIDNKLKSLQEFNLLGVANALSGGGESKYYAELRAQMTERQMDLKIEAEMQQEAADAAAAAEQRKRMEVESTNEFIFKSRMKRKAEEDRFQAQNEIARAQLATGKDKRAQLEGGFDLDISEAKFQRDFSKLEVLQKKKQIALDQFDAEEAARKQSESAAAKARRGQARGDLAIAQLRESGQAGVAGLAEEGVKSMREIQEAEKTDPALAAILRRKASINLRSKAASLAGGGGATVAGFGAVSSLAEIGGGGGFERTQPQVAEQKKTNDILKQTYDVMAKLLAIEEGG